MSRITSAFVLLIGTIGTLGCRRVDTGVVADDFSGAAVVIYVGATRSNSSLRLEVPANGILLVDVAPPNLTVFELEDSSGKTVEYIALEGVAKANSDCSVRGLGFFVPRGLAVNKKANATKAVWQKVDQAFRKVCSSGELLDPAAVGPPEAARSNWHSFRGSEAAGAWHKRR